MDLSIKFKCRTEFWNGGTHLILTFQLSHYVLDMTIHVLFCTKHT
jgi:hypothetical protein